MLEQVANMSNNICRDRLGRLNLTLSIALWTADEVTHSHTWTHALTCHLHDAELTDLEYGRASTVTFKILVESIFDRTTMAGIPHVDEVVDDQPAQVTKTELAADFIGRFHVRLVCIGLTVLGRPTPPGVHIDGNQRFRLINHKSATRWQVYFTLVNDVDLSFHIKGVEDWEPTPVPDDFRP